MVAVISVEKVSLSEASRLFEEISGYVHDLNEHNGQNLLSNRYDTCDTHCLDLLYNVMAHVVSEVVVAAAVVKVEDSNRYIPANIEFGYVCSGEETSAELASNGSGGETLALLASIFFARHSE
uniref:Uncharacterized protein n=1 Tax=Tanacetum cinerariifolium TaxID=118510 RepID=A0A6L2KJ77_TANCI|nr:hypothetical protein [Tanacetum cinerariifolium]